MQTIPERAEEGRTNRQTRRHTRKYFPHRQYKERRRRRRRRRRRLKSERYETKRNKTRRNETKRTEPNGRRSATRAQKSHSYFIFRRIPYSYTYVYIYIHILYRISSISDISCFISHFVAGSETNDWLKEGGGFVHVLQPSHLMRFISVFNSFVTLLCFVSTTSLPHSLSLSPSVFSPLLKRISQGIWGRLRHNKHKTK